MIRATELAGRAVVDIDAAEKIGTVDRMILDPDGQCVAGFIIARHGSGFPGTRDHVLLPASAVHAIGPDAVTVRQSVVAGSDMARLENLPRGSDLIGRKVVSEDGRFLGKVSDVLIDRTDGRILGYLLAEHTPGSRFEEMLGSNRNPREMPYLPADAKLRAGRDLLVASEDAVNYDWTDEDEDVAAEHAGDTPPTSRWGYTPPPGSSEPGEAKRTGP
jgi:sporulation protein YlmC with PRC-barrel domain